MDHHNTTPKGSAMNNRLNQVLHNVIDILEADNSASFEEKKEQALSLLLSRRDYEPVPTACCPETKTAICTRLQEEFCRTGDQVDAGLVVLRRENASDKGAYKLPNRCASDISKGVVADAIVAASFFEYEASLDFPTQAEKNGFCEDFCEVVIHV